MSGGGGGGSAPKTPESEKASKRTEAQRYDMAAGINMQVLPRYVVESQRDLSDTIAGRANADIMSKSGNAYIGNNPFPASQTTSAVTNARNTAIIRARGEADLNRIKRTDAALNSLNGRAEDAARGLLDISRRQSDLEWQKIQDKQAVNSSKWQVATGVLGTLGGVAYDMHTRGELGSKGSSGGWLGGLFGGKKSGGNVGGTYASFTGDDGRYNR